MPVQTGHKVGTLETMRPEMAGRYNDVPPATVQKMCDAISAAAGSDALGELLDRYLAHITRDGMSVPDAVDAAISGMGR